MRVSDTPRTWRSSTSPLRAQANAVRAILREQRYNKQQNSMHATKQGYGRSASMCAKGQVRLRIRLSDLCSMPSGSMLPCIAIHSCSDDPHTPGVPRMRGHSDIVEQNGIENIRKQARSEVA